MQASRAGWSPHTASLVARGTDAEHWNLDSPSHLLNAAGGLSFLLHLIPGPSIHPSASPSSAAHPPGDRHNALFHQCITNRMKHFANLIEKVLKNGNIPEFQFRHFDKKKKKKKKKEKEILQRETRLLSFNTSEWRFSTLNFSVHRQLFSFQNRTACVCLNATGNRGSV